MHDHGCRLLLVVLRQDQRGGLSVCRIVLGRSFGLLSRGSHQKPHPLPNALGCARMVPKAKTRWFAALAHTGVSRRITESPGLSVPLISRSISIINGRPRAINGPPFARHRCDKPKTAGASSYLRWQISEIAVPVHHRRDRNSVADRVLSHPAILALPPNIARGRRTGCPASSPGDATDRRPLQSHILAGVQVEIIK